MQFFSANAFVTFPIMSGLCNYEMVPSVQVHIAIHNSKTAASKLEIDSIYISLCIFASLLAGDEFATTITPILGAQQSNCAEKVTERANRKWKWPPPNGTTFISVCRNYYFDGYIYVWGVKQSYGAK